MSAGWITFAIILAVVLMLIAYSFTPPRIPTRLERLNRETDAEIRQRREQACRDWGQS